MTNDKAREVLCAAFLFAHTFVWTCWWCIACVPGVLLMMAADVFGGPFQRALYRLEPLVWGWAPGVEPPRWATAAVTPPRDAGS